MVLTISEDKNSKLKELIALFEDNINQYKGKHYDEAKTRADFIDKFFELFDWDIYNIQGFSEQYRDVVREDRVEIKGKVKAPDYSFRIGGMRKFFVEAKKPSVDIKYDIEPAFQLRRYAYTCKMPVSILTDFEEFAVYDTRIKPVKTDKAAAARIFYCTYHDYIDQFDFLFNTFSKQAILKGYFDKFVQKKKPARGTSEVDKEFLKLIEKWRENLAKNIALRNKDLSIYELNYAVQKIIDRIIFLRIAEDRHIEEYGRLQKVMEQKKTLYPLMVDLFAQADVKYNSGLFDLIEDEITPNLHVDDKVLKDIIKNLYYPDSPYEFSVFDVEILGNIYEQFLGKTIRLTPSHQARVEDKPEVKKAGGVYYTPKYIVDYIVKHTVGEKISNKSPKEISGLRILDPACGSGSFLLGAYQLLMEYHLEYYTKEKNLKKALKENKIYQWREKEYRLTIEEKRHILLNNIFGVDIDPQAVEVTRLSLLLKLLEGETHESTGLLFKYTDITILPDLSDNIKCGNSLIGPDFYETGQLSLFQDEETVRRINVFDWQKEFPDIFNQGGFDIVIGNPPYGNIGSKEEQDYFSKKYSNQDYQKDLYLLFFERYNLLLKNLGLLGIITSNTWLQSVTYKNIRKFLTTIFRWKKVLILQEKVFRAVVDTHVVVFEKSNDLDYEKISFDIEIFKKGKTILSHSLLMKDIPVNGDVINIIADAKSRNLYLKILKDTISLKKISKVFNGTKPFEKGKGNPPQTEKIMKEKPYVKKGECPGPEWKKLLRGNLIKKYLNLWDKDYWILYGEWLAAPRNPYIFEAPTKIMVRQTGDSIIATLIEGGFIARDNLHIILPYDADYNLRFVLGIINSKLMDFVYSFLNPEKGEALAQVKKKHIEALPIPIVDFSNHSDKSRHGKMVELVEQMLEIQKKFHSAKLETEKKMFKTQINALDKQIDQLVYELYELTPEEIAIVEGESE